MRSFYIKYILGQKFSFFDVKKIKKNSVILLLVAGGKCFFLVLTGVLNLAGGSLVQGERGGVALPGEVPGRCCYRAVKSPCRVSGNSRAG